MEGKTQETHRLAAFGPVLVAPLISGAAGVLAAAAFCTAAPGDMRLATNDLADAMRTEAYDYVTYRAYAEAARRNGNPDLALLYERNANIEWRSHFSGHADFARLIRSDAQNIRASIAREDDEARRLYPQMAKRAEARGERKVAEWLRFVASDEARQREDTRRPCGASSGKRSTPKTRLDRRTRLEHSWSVQLLEVAFSCESPAARSSFTWRRS
jgi:rubrerythrin